MARFLTRCDTNGAVCSQVMHCDGSEATYTKGPWSYMYLLGIFLFVHWGAVGLPLPENLGYLHTVPCANSLMARGIYWP